MSNIKKKLKNERFIQVKFFDSNINYGIIV